MIEVRKSLMATLVLLGVSSLSQAKPDAQAVARAAKAACLTSLAKSSYFSVHTLNVSYRMSSVTSAPKTYVYTLQPNGTVKGVEKVIGVLGTKNYDLSFAMVNSAISLGQVQTLLIAKALNQISGGAQISKVELDDLREKLADCESVNADGPSEPEATSSLDNRSREHLGQKASRLREALKGTNPFLKSDSAKSPTVN